MEGIIVNREMPTEYGVQLKMLSELIEEVVNYGEVIIFTLKDSYLDESKYTPIFTLFVHILDIADSIATVIRIGSGLPANILLRSLFEATISLIYLLESSDEKGVIAYKVFHANEEIKNLRKLDKKQPSGNEYLKKHEEFTGIKLDSKDFNEVARPLLQYLSKPEIRKVNEEYRNMKKNKRFFNWYSMFEGPKNLAQLSEKIEDMWILYQHVYIEGSKDVHGSGTLKNIVSNGEESILKEIRNSHQINFQGVISISLLLNVYKKSLLIVRPDEEINYAKWYRANIKKEFRRFAKEFNFTVEYK